jgi:non-ribosomal peptide synthase protein (TIGR01720 family)
LLGECNKAYRTQVNDLLLSALLRAYQRWSGGRTLCVQMEGHGREALFGHLDTNETVGWYTSVYPLLLGESPDADLETLIKSVKEQVRGVPNRGIGYGVLVELCGDEALREAGERLSDRAIEVNYLGQFDGTLSRTTAFRIATEPAGASSSEANQGDAPISIHAAVHDGRLTVGVLAAASVRDAVGLTSMFAQALGESIEHCGEVAMDASINTEYSSVFDADDSELLQAEIEL